MELWPFQKAIVSDARDALRDYSKICIVLPTGAGKTAVSGHISMQIAQQLEKGGQDHAGSTLYLVHRRELLTQTASTLDRVGLSGKYGIIAAGEPAMPWKPIQIASIPTLHSRIKKGSYLNINPKVIFVDEGHHATANTWAMIIDKYPNAFVIFLTATPYRTDNKGLGNMIDHLVVGPGIKELVEQGYLAGTRAFSVTTEFSKIMNEKKRAMLDDHQKKIFMASVTDNWERLASDRKSLFFASSIQHSLMIVDELRARGYSAEHVDWKTPDLERKRILEDARSGRLQCVSNMKLFTEGTDWPECSCVVLARRTGSLTEYRQMNGRMMRRKESGDDGILIDLVGNVHEHGLPDADIEWELEYGIDKEQKKKIRAAARVCERCGYEYPRIHDECTLCGHVPTTQDIEEINTVVTELSDLPSQNKPRKKKYELQRLVRATGGNYEELEAIRKENGYSPAWVNQMRRVYKWDRK